jgi:putative ABC transport system permease protein
VADLFSDLRLGARLLVKNPGYTTVVALTLALAIGSNTVIFSFTELLLLRPLPLGDPARTVFLYTVDKQRGVNRGRTSMPDFLDWRDQATAFDLMAAEDQTAFTLTGSGEPIRVTAQRATASLLTIWELAAVRGRTFAPGEDAPGAQKVAVLSHRFWVEHYASDADIVGRSITLSGDSYTVVGVLTPAIEVGNLASIDLWVPFPIDRAGARRDVRTLQVVARLKPGASRDRANTELATIAERLAQAYPDTNGGRSARLLKARDAITGSDTWLVLALLTVVVAFVLMIACANVANMMLARATARSKEMAVRVALGASRGRLVRQLLSESLLLGLTGGAFGLVVAKQGLRAIQAGSFEPFFRLLTINATVLAFTFGLAVLAPILFSIVPAIHASRTDLNETLKESGRRTAGGAKGRRSRALLVVSQLALAVMLLVVAGLVVRSISALERAPTGIDSQNVLRVQIQLEAPTHVDLPQANDFAGRLVERLGAMPGVAAAGIADRLPLLDNEPPARFRIPGRPLPDPKDVPWANQTAIGGDYFRVFNIPIVAGRLFSARDDRRAPEVALISREAVRRYWNGKAPVGEHIELVGDNFSEAARLEIVGVVEDVKSSNLEEPPPPRVYRPLAQMPTRGPVIVVRTSGDPAGVAPVIRETIRSEDRDLALSNIRTVDSLLREDFRENYLLVGLFFSFALVALALAGTGLYGVTSYSVSQRTQEIGIRMALGATAGDVLRLIVTQNAMLIGVGAFVGVLGGAALGRTMRSILYSVGTTDPATFAAVLAILATVALAASYVPARRATRVDPLECLRIE